MNLNYVRVVDADSEVFAAMWSIYIDSFPLNERRSLDYQKETLQLDEYHCEAIFNAEQLIGLIWWWSLEDVRFIEHLAVSSQVRGGGYGAEVIKQFIARSELTTLLEVEHPECELSKRRIGFYSRLGFVLNEHCYSHPSYSQDGVRVELLIMTHPQEVSGEWLDSFKECYFPLIHFRG